MNNEKTLVTGGGGFLGKAIVKKLLENKIQVKSFSRNLYLALEQMGVEQVQGDITDFKAVDKAMSDVNVVYHVAAKAGMWGKYKDFYDINVNGTANVVKACFNNKIERMIHTSSPSVILHGADINGGDETLPYPDKYYGHYPKTKAKGERLVKGAALKGLKTIILRPHFIWGPEDNHLLPRILARAKRLRKIGNTNDLVDTIYVDNAADAHILAEKCLEKNPDLSGNIYFISQDEPISKWEMIDHFFDAAGLPPVKGYISHKGAFIAGSLLEFFYGLFNMKKEPPMTRFAANELATSHWFDISKAKKDLGYYPEVSTKEGLLRLRQWLSKYRTN